MEITTMNGKVFLFNTGMQQFCDLKCMWLKRPLLDALYLSQVWTVVYELQGFPAKNEEKSCW